MPAYVTEVIIWTCVAAFVVCVIAGLAAILGIWEPRDPAVKKWLRNGVVISVVGAVAAFGVRQFAAPSPQPIHNDKPTPPPGKPPAPGPVPNVPTSEPKDSEQNSAQPEEGSPEPSPNPPKAPEIPADLQAWATKNLGPRPVLPADADKQYPQCVARLRSGSTTADSSDALDCRRDLQQFHMDVIVAYYDVKKPYDHNLEAQEAALRKFGVQTDELPRYNYIIAEMDRLNSPDSAEENAVSSLEGRVLDDIQRCSKSACR